MLNDVEWLRVRQDAGRWGRFFCFYPMEKLLYLFERVTVDGQLGSAVPAALCHYWALRSFFPANFFFLSCLFFSGVIFKFIWRIFRIVIVMRPVGSVLKIKKDRIASLGHISVSENCI